MQAYVVDHSTPSGIALRDVASPRASRGVAVVAVTATSLNVGESRRVRNHEYPHGGRVGSDFAGVVKEQATDGSGWGVGTEVFGWCADPGSWASELAVRVDRMAPIPAGVSMVEASTL